MRLLKFLGHCEFISRMRYISHKMHSQEVIEKWKAEIPKMKNLCDYTIYGITHLDIELCDGSVKQIGKAFSLFSLKITDLVLVLIFERLRVEEPQVFLKKNQIYADVYIKICDQVLAGKCC